MKGSVTTIGLDMSARANSASVTAWRIHPGLEAFHKYASRVSRKKKALNTSLRSAIHATDSTCAGCQPKNAATRALRQTAPVIFCRSRKSSATLALCRRTLVR